MKKFIILILAGLYLGDALFAQLTTYAGAYPLGDGGAATSAAIDRPTGIVFDPIGNLYISDALQNRIRKVTPAGIISTFAGNGLPFTTGDGGLAVNAGINQPQGMAFDGAGNLYICGANRIRVITPAGIILTAVGTGLTGFSGDGGPATAARISGPSFVTFDSLGNMYFSDTDNNRVRQVSTAGVITTYAGTGVAGFGGDGGLATAAQLNRPVGVAVDPAGNVYVSDVNNSRIRRITPAGIISTFAGTGVSGFNGDGISATSAQLRTPFGLRFQSGSLYFADYLEARIRTISAAGIISTVAGTSVFGFTGDGGLATAARLYIPVDIAFSPGGDLHIVDGYNDRIRRVSSGVISTVAGASSFFGVPGSASAGIRLVNPGQIGMSAAGTLYIPEYYNDRVLSVAAGGGSVAVAAGNGIYNISPDGSPATAGVYAPSAVCVAPAGSPVYFAEADSRYRTLAGGVFGTIAGTGVAGTSGDGGPGTAAQISSPSGCAVDGAGNFYFADSTANRVRRVDTSGIITTIAGNGTGSSTGDGGLATAATLNNPSAVAIDSSGNIFISEGVGQRIRKITPAGIISTVAGTGTFGYSGDGGPATAARLGAPSGIAVDLTGNLYIAENGNHVVRKVTTAGVITTIAGTGTAGLGANQLAFPAGVAVDAAGTVYVSDSLNRVMSIPPAGACTTSLSPTSFSASSGVDGSSFFINTQTGCAWTASTPSSFVTISSATSGSGPARLSFSVGTNSGGARVGTIVVNGQTFTINQAGSTSCTYSLAPSSASVPAGSSVVSFTVNAPSGCPWTVTGLPSWISVLFGGGSSGGTGGVQLTISGNPTTSSRNAAIQAGGQTYSVTQAGASVASPTITTVAGGAINDGGLPGNAFLNLNIGFARVRFDAAGNLYIVDGIDQRIRRVSGSGTITTVAGNGVSGYSGDGGAATSAMLDTPSDVAIDAAGNLFIADHNNHRIRKVTPAGIISTIAGTGVAGVSGNGGPAVSAQISNPRAFALDGAGSLYFADDSGVRVIDAAGDISTVPLSGISGPIFGLTLDSSGALYVCDVSTFRVWRVGPNGAVTAFAGNGTQGNSGDGGPATSAQLNRPEDLAFDATGNLYIADELASVIRKVSPGGVISTFPTTGFFNPGGVAPAATGELFVADRQNVWRVSTSGVSSAYTTHPGSGDGGPAVNASLYYPRHVAVDPNGVIYIADEFDNKIRKVALDGTISTFAGTGSGSSSGNGGPATAAGIPSPAGLAIDLVGSVYIAEFARIRKVAADGTISTLAGGATAGFSGDGGPATVALLNRPNDVVLDAAGNVYVADTGNHRVRRITPAGVISTIAGNGSAAYSGDGGPATSASLNNPSALAITPNGDLLIADTFNDRIRRVNLSTGIITSAAGTGSRAFSGDGGLATSAGIDTPQGLAVDTAGNIYISDQGGGTLLTGNRIRRILTSGIIETIAGNIPQGFAGDGGPAALARFVYQQGVATDNAGNVYVADTESRRIRRITGLIPACTYTLGSNSFSAPASGASSSFSLVVSPAACTWLSTSSVPWITITSSPGGAGNGTINFTVAANAGSARNGTLTVGGQTFTINQAGATACNYALSTLSLAAAGVGRDSSVTVIAPAGCGWTASAVVPWTTITAGTSGSGNGTVTFHVDANPGAARSGTLIIAGQTLTVTQGVATPAYTATLYAGNFPMGDGGPAINAPLTHPLGVTTDAAGNLFVADQLDYRIRRITPAGIISTYAGSGVDDYRGDGGPASLAGILPQLLTFDSAGNLYFSDGGNRIRMVSTSGVITTIAGTGTSGFSGDGGSALLAQISVINLTADAAGNIYFTEFNNNRIRKVSTSGIVTTIAGTGVIGFAGDGGPAIAAQLSEPDGITLDTAGNIYFGDNGNRRIRKIDTAGVITTYAGTGNSNYNGEGVPALSANINFPTGVKFLAGKLYFVDEGLGRVRVIDSTGNISTVAGNGTFGRGGDGGPATSAQLANIANDLAMDPAGNIYIADTYNFRIRKVNTSGIISTFAGASQFAGEGGPAVGARMVPDALAVDAAGNLIVSERANMRISRVPAGGASLNTIAGTGEEAASPSPDGSLAASSPISFPLKACTGAGGDVYFGESAMLRRISGGILTTVAGTGVFGFSGDGGPATAAQLEEALGCAFDSSGNLFFNDFAANRIRRVNSSGVISTVAGNGSAVFSGDGGPATAAGLNAPYSLTRDAAGNLYFSERSLRVRRISTAGVISTVVGNGTAGYAGDGGLATSANLGGLSNIAADAAGNLYIADYNSNVVRKVDTAGVITTIYGTGNAGLGSGELLHPGGIAVNSAGTVFVSDDANRVLALNPTACNIAIAPLSAAFPIGGGAGSVSVTTAAGCVWTATASDTWITLTGPTAGVGTGTVSFTVGTNSAGTRSGSIVISGQVFTITQDAQPTSSAPIVSVPNVNLRLVGGQGSSTPVKITSNLPNVPFTIQVNAANNWFTVSPLSGTLPATITITVAANLAPGIYTGSVTIGVPGGSSTIIPMYLAVSDPPKVITNQQPLVVANVDGNQITTEIPVLASGAGVAFTATLDGIPGVSVQPASGTLPAALRLVPSGTLAPGDYQGTVTVNTPLGSPTSTKTVVRFTVAKPAPAELAVDTGTLSFSTGTAAASSRQFIVRNLGTGSVSYKASVLGTPLPSWLSVTPAGGVTSADGAVALDISTNFTGLPGTVYQATIRVESSTTGKIVDTMIRVVASGGDTGFAVSQSGLIAEAVAGINPPPQNIEILNQTGAPHTFKTSIQTISGPDGWLSVTPPTGRLDPGASIALRATANVKTLPAGVYYAVVQVTSDDGLPPHSVTVVANVLTASAPSVPALSATGAVFVGSGGGNPDPRKITLSNVTGRTLTVLSAAFSGNPGRNWLQVFPASAKLNPGDAVDFTLQPLVAGLGVAPLGPGVYRGEVVLGILEDNSTRRIDVLLVVPATAPARASVKGQPRAATGCAPTRLLPVFTLLGNDFNSTVNWPSPVEVTVVDDCGTPQVQGSVSVGFSNNDPVLTLTPLNDGRWAGTWQARNPRPNVTVTSTAVEVLSAVRLEGLVRVTGMVTAQSAASLPAVSSGGIINAADHFSPSVLSPGAAVVIRGSNLATSQRSTDVAPLPNILGDTEVSIAGTLLPLSFVSDSEIHAILPFGLATDTTYPLLVRRGSSISLPAPVVVSRAVPAIYTADDSGSGQAKIYTTAADGSEHLADPGNPARPGDSVRILCAGLGQVNPQVNEGAAGPASPQAAALARIGLTIGGQDAAVGSAVLAPGLVGVYSVSASVPVTLPSSMQTLVVLTANGVASQPVTMAIQ